MPILHLTHLNADADSFASAYWGYRVFGGGLYVHNPDSTVVNLMKKLGVQNVMPSRIHSFYVYDTSNPKKIPLTVYNYRIFDHHVNNCTEFVEKATFAYIRQRTANVMNLYDLSKEIELDEDVLFAFAVALVTDTGFLKAARSEEIQYLGKFLNNHVLEDVFEIVLADKINSHQKFIDILSTMEIVGMKSEIGIVQCDNDDEFLCVVDLLMLPLDLSIIIGKLPWGIWVYCRKKLVQKVYQGVLSKFQDREAGKLYGFYDVRLIVELLTDL